MSHFHVHLQDRSDSFDFNVALQDHFKYVKNAEALEKEKADPKPILDLGFKEGETIKINMKITVSRFMLIADGQINFFFDFSRKKTAARPRRGRARKPAA